MSQVRNLGFGCGIFLMLWMLSAVSAQNELELPFEEDFEPSKQEVQEMLRTILTLFEDSDNDTNTNNVNARCSCGGLTCTCCQYIRVRKLRISDNCCLSVMYLRRNYGILIRLRFGSRTLFSKEVSARNPPPVCVGVPYLTKGASVCVQFYNMNVAKRSLSGCARFLGRLFFVTVVKINLGCFRMNFLDASEPMETVELPYLDGPQVYENYEPLDEDIPMEKIVPAKNGNKL